MRSTSKFIAACGAVLLLLAAAGCGSDGDDGSGAGPAAINGNNGAGQGTETGTRSAASPRPASSAGPSLTMPPRESQKPLHTKVVIQTSKGPITVELYDDKAPGTVENFLVYVDRGFYDRTIFHQVFPRAVILGGVFTPEFAEKEGAGLPIRNEAEHGLKNVRGTIAMARQYNIPDSATCGFFINVKDNPNYDYKPEVRLAYENPEDYGYCVFGEVIDGMDVADQIAGVEVQDIGDFERVPVQTVLIESIRRVP